MQRQETQAAKVFRWLVLLGTAYCVVVLALSGYSKITIATGPSNPINTSMGTGYAMVALALVGVLAILCNLRRSTRMIFACYMVVFWNLVTMVLGLLLRLQHGADTPTLLLLLGNLLACGACVLHHKAQHYL